MKRNHVRNHSYAKATLMVCSLAFTAGLTSARGAPQDAPAGPSARVVEALEKRLDQLSASVNDLREEVRRSHQEAAELRKELNDTRAQLGLQKRVNRDSHPADVGETMAATAPAAAGPTPTGKEFKEKLDEVEENQQLLQSKVDDQYQIKVESASRYRVRLSGIALLNVFSNRGAVDNADVPNFARDRGPLDSSGSFGATVRQSMIGLQVFGPEIGKARTSADVQFDFFGGFPGTGNGAANGLVRLRTARMRMDWDRTSLVAGQDEPFISPLSPASLASLADPAMSYSGNLWNWIPQVRVEHQIPVTDSSKVEISAGFLDPMTGEPPYNQYYRTPQAGERSRQPAYAARLAWKSSAWKQPFSFGLGSYYSRQDWGFGRKVDGWAATADWQVPVGPKVGLSGEFYRGRAIGGLGAGEGRSVLYNGSLLDPTTSVLGLNASGGWAQLKVSPTKRLEFNGAFGEDMPDGQDLSRFTTSSSYVASQLGRNQTGFFNFIYRARSNVLFSGEYRRIWTFEKYEPKHTANVIGLSMGVLF